MLEAIGNNPALMLLLLIVGTALVGGATLWRLRGEWALFQAWRAAGMPTPAQSLKVAPGSTEAPASVSFDPTPLEGAGRAMKNAPANLSVIIKAMADKGEGRYRFPLGWTVGGLNTGRFVGDINHVLITGQSDAGKDNAVMGILLSLALQHKPADVQFCIIDGKGLDWAGWQEKAHTWRLALDPEDMAPAMTALTDERQRRRKILQAAGAAKWDEYQGHDLPLLVVYVSELLLLQNATSGPKLTAWLNSELTAARAFGIRFIIATQTASNFDTQWRSQISLFMAGFQPAPAQDAPNTGLTTAELEQLGGVPPSKLPAPPAGAGVFTAVQGRDLVTIRASYLNSQHRQHVLAQLPNRPVNISQEAPKKPIESTQLSASTPPDQVLLQLLQSGQPLPISDEPRSAAIAHHSGLNQNVAVRSTDSVLSVTDLTSTLVVAADIVPANEQARILAAAQEATSRRQVSLKLYEVAGGHKYKWVQAVCDAAGLLQSTTGGA